MIFIRLNYEGLKKSWFPISLLACFTAAVALLVFLDYFNLESIAAFNDRGFYFDYTWKGRLFILFFLWLFVLETSLNSETLLEKEQKSKPRSKIKILAIFVCAIIPIVYILSVNFLGLDQTVIQIGDALRGEYWRANFADWNHILNAAWPLSIEYLMFTVSFLATILLAYGKESFKTFSITFALIAGISTVYMIDTIFPYGVFKPLQMLALPTAACAAALLEFLGYSFTLSFSPGLESAPIIRMSANDSAKAVSIAWPCAGVHSLFLYTLIALLLFRRSNISSFRKVIYFVVGAIGTYFVNILRIVSFFSVLVNQGMNAAQTFHDVYGELFSVVWILFYVLLINCIQKFRLIEKTRALFGSLGPFRSKNS